MTVKEAMERLEKVYLGLIDQLCLAKTQHRCDQLNWQIQGKIAQIRRLKAIFDEHGNQTLSPAEITSLGVQQ